MPRLALALLIATLTAPAARADVAETVAGHILPRYAAFAEATGALARAAEADCTPSALQAPYQAAFDAWMGVAHLQFGPAEEQGRALAVEFWPDPKGLGAKGQKALLALPEGALTAQAMAEASVASRGLMALERLLYPDDTLAGDTCALTRATAADLAATAAAINDGWTAGGYGAALTGAGAAGNSLYLAPEEARRALLTQLATGLEVLADDRLGRPLGTFDKPRPERAEARASGRSLRNVQLELAALREMAAALDPKATLTLAALDRAIGLAGGLEDPVFAGVAEPGGRLKVEILQQAVQSARDQAIAEIGAALGVTLGFNAQDGD